MTMGQPCLECRNRFWPSLLTVGFCRRCWATLSARERQRILNVSDRRWFEAFFVPTPTGAWLYAGPSFQASLLVPQKTTARGTA